MIKLLPLIALAIVSYASFQINQKLAGGKADSLVVGAVANLFPVLIFSSILLLSKYRQTNLLPTTKEGVIFAVFSGISVAIFAISFAKIFQKGGEVSVISPMVFGASIVLSIAFGIFFLHEKTSVIGLSGMFLVVIGLLLIARANA